MTIVEELRSKVSRDNRELLDRAAEEIKNLTIENGKLEMEIAAAPPYKVGEMVWCLEKEDGEYCGVVGEMFLAVAGNAVITSAFLDCANETEDILEYYIGETQDNNGVEVSFYPLEDCFSTRKEAEEALARIKLKPCPFCGGEAVMYHQSGKYADYDADYVYCMSCGCQTKLFQFFKGAGQTREDNEREAMNAWNRRVDNAEREADSSAMP